MSAAAVSWLRETFITVPDVKSASRQPNSASIFQTHQADLVVQTWMGARLYIYLITEPPKVRDLRNKLKDNSRSRIGTLFLVNSQLLPEDHTRVEIEDWQDALMQLNDGWIYGYELNEGDGTIMQVHFNPTTIMDQYDCWYLRDFAIENVAVRRRNVQQTIKGEWSIGDIASPGYKRRVNYERVNQRFHYRTKRTQSINKAPNDELVQSYKMLGLERSAAEDDVKRAFRKLALQLHPDVSALPKFESERRFKEVMLAYERIKEYHGWH